MKSTLVIVLGASAILNAVLLVGGPRPHRPEVAEASAVVVGAPLRGDGGSEARTAGAADAARASAAARRGEVGQLLESTDLATLRDGLRAAGFPETIVRALVGRRIEEQIEARRLQRLGPTKVEPFWKTYDSFEERRVRSVERALAREQRALSAELLGAGAMAGDVRAYMADRLRFLSPAKVELIRAIEADYSDMISDVRSDGYGPGVSLPEDQEKLRMLQREKEADIAAALTPEEYELYQLHQSSTANTLRGRLRGFDVTEEEFRALYALQKVYDDRFQAGRIGPRTAEEQRARSTADRELKDQFKVVLGESRYAEYERSTSSAYRAAVNIVEHFNLPRENAVSVHALEAEARRRHGELAQSAASTAERASAMQALATEMAGRIDALLGAEGGRVFRTYGGSWFRVLEEQAQRGSASARRP